MVELPVGIISILLCVVILSVTMLFRRMISKSGEEEEERFEVQEIPASHAILLDNPRFSEELGQYYEQQEGFAYRYKAGGVAMVAFSKSYEALRQHFEDNPNTR